MNIYVENGNEIVFQKWVNMKLAWFNLKRLKKTGIVSVSEELQI